MLGALGASTRGCRASSLMSDRERGLKDYEKTCMDISTRIWLNRGTLGRTEKLYDYKASKYGIYFVSLLGLICLNRNQSSTLHQVLPSSRAAALCLPENIRNGGQDALAPSSEGRAAKAAWKYQGQLQRVSFFTQHEQPKNLINKTYVNIHILHF